MLANLRVAKTIQLLMDGLEHKMIKDVVQRNIVSTYVTSASMALLQGQRKKGTFGSDMNAAVYETVTALLRYDKLDESTVLLLMDTVRQDVNNGYSECLPHLVQLCKYKGYKYMCGTLLAELLATSTQKLPVCDALQQLFQHQFTADFLEDKQAI